MSDGAAVPATAAGSTGETDTLEETAQQREERQFQAASAATTLSRRLSKQQRKSAAASKVPAVRSDFFVECPGCPEAQPKPRQSKSETGLMALMEDILPSNCVLRRNGCWPKKKAKRTVK
ncbi:unnamed protein product [Cladocopium goreaui]|uniref:Uncharacterized protein n=1 Tax=Cladocopium goreaui TaxID=2562237 RepID=A0A9P1G7N7_9DINO|nr:unnamed protein product [Cladocopium goreaui]|mmetsp:Transcript_21075/g.46377  ORF Transcript_21075/g.46377 Transcript_21075/m.46377 type:complete len:120 (+) Transcript_21075:36-395(+)